MKKHLLLLCAFCVSLYGHSQKIYKMHTKLIYVKLSKEM